MKSKDSLRTVIPNIKSQITIQARHFIGMHFE